MAVALSVVTGASFLASSANATVIITFGQQGNVSTVTGTANSPAVGKTTITSTNTAVTISQIDAASPVPISAFLDLSVTSTGAATNAIAGNIIQTYSGTFSITSGINDTGINYLTGTLQDLALGQNAAFTLTASNPPSAISFTSGVITDLALPLGASLSFANVTPGLQIVGSGATATFGSFTSSISGTFSANPPPTLVPEPASLALLGMGLFGIGMVRRRRMNANNEAA